MERFLGKWEVTSTENMDNMLQAVGESTQNFIPTVFEC
jgi:hypothetical protein